jgi:UDP-N-acetylmuramate--alanine ligase
VLPSITRRVKTYGESVQADFVARDIQLHREDGRVGLSYEFVERRQPLGRIRMEVSGRHNVLNSLAAAAVGRELDLKFEQIREGLAAFRGVARRLERKGEANGIRVIDDYGHHPTEVAAVLATLREAYDGRLLVAFQPHRYTRTRDLYEQFGRCFLQSDRLFLLPVYAAGEPPIPGVDSELIARSARGAGHKSVDVVSGADELVDRIAAEARPGDVVLTLGAGDITKLGEPILARLGASGPRGTGAA